MMVQNQVYDGAVMEMDILLWWGYMYCSHYTDGTNSSSSETQRRNSFVGTAQYVSPEVLTSKQAYFR